MDGLIAFLRAYNDYKGDFQVSIRDDDIHVEHADPRILISAELLDIIREGGWPETSFDGDVLSIEASNRTVAYRVGPPIPGDRDRFCPADLIEQSG